MSTTVTYSEAPIASIDENALSNTRFLDLAERKLPYRDSLGRVNINLVQASLAKLAHAADQESTKEHRTKLEAWQRHARRALDARPDDERLTLAELWAADDAEVKSNKSSEDLEAPGTVAMPRRLFSPKPRKGDEPDFSDDSADSDEVPLTADLLHLAHCGALDKKKRNKAKKQKKSEKRPTAGRASPSASSEEDVYEVEAVLEEDESGEGHGFLIRWAGYGPAHDSWEPESNVASDLVAAFRHERALARTHRGDDYLVGRTRMLWCKPCATHLPIDSFSASQRKCCASSRSCLNHHYKGNEFKTHVSSTHVVVHQTPHRASHAATPGSSSRKRARAADDDSDDDDEERERLSLPPSRERPQFHAGPSNAPTPTAPRKAVRPVVSARLGHRAAALEMQRCRLFGFGA